MRQDNHKETVGALRQNADLLTENKQQVVFCDARTIVLSNTCHPALATNDVGIVRRGSGDGSQTRVISIDRSLQMQKRKKTVCSRPG
jgi:hypothetical protein